MRMPRETEEEMTARVEKMQGIENDKDNKDNKDNQDNKDDKEVDGVQLELEQTGANAMPHVPQETGLKSEKDDKEKGDDDEEDETGNTNENPDKVVIQGKDKDSPEDILTTSNADKRIKDAQTKMHQKASEASESKALLDEANLKVKSYEAIIAKSGVNSTEGIKAQQNINDTNIETVADIQALEKEYPEIAKPLINAFNRMQGQLDSMAKQQTTSTESMQESNEKVLSDIHFNRISEFHPDYANISKSQEFTDWVNGLSPFEHSAALRVKEDGDADESISMLDKFKEDTGYSNGTINTNTNDDKISDDDKAKANLDLAKTKVSPTFSKSKQLKLKSNDKQLTLTEMREMAPTKENEDRILKAMNSGTLIS